MAGSGAGHWRKDECPTYRGRGQPRCDVRDRSFHGVLSCFLVADVALCLIVAALQTGDIAADIHSNLLLAGTSHFLGVRNALDEELPELRGLRDTCRTWCSSTTAATGDP
jgi:hypothetical protein